MSYQIQPYCVRRDVDIMIEVESFRSRLLEWRLEYAFANWRDEPLPQMPELSREMSYEYYGGARRFDVQQLWCEIQAARTDIEHARMKSARGDEK